MPHYPFYCKVTDVPTTLRGFAPSVATERSPEVYAATPLEGGTHKRRGRAPHPRVQSSLRQVQGHAGRGEEEEERGLSIWISR